MNEYKLSDNVIANVIQLLQLSMITGMDISDHFRMITLSPSELSPDKLELAQSYVESHEKLVASLLKDAEDLSAKMQKEQNSNSFGFVN